MNHKLLACLGPFQISLMKLFCYKRAKKTVVLFPEIGRVKFFLSFTRLHSRMCIRILKNILSLTRPHSRMCIRIYIFNFKKQANKQKKTRIQKKQKKLKKKREYIRKINKNKYICGRPGEDFSRHSHIRKQEYFSFGLVTGF